MSRILNLSKRVISYSRKFVVHRYVKGSRRSFFFFFLFLKILLDTIRFPKKFPRKFVSIRSIGRYNCDALLKGERGGVKLTPYGYPRFGLTFQKAVILGGDESDG